MQKINVLFFPLSLSIFFNVVDNKWDCSKHLENDHLTLLQSPQVHLPRAGPGGGARAVGSGDQRHDQPVGRGPRRAHQRRGNEGKQQLILGGRFEWLETHRTWRGGPPSPRASTSGTSPRTSRSGSSSRPSRRGSR